ncbi:Na+ dependent nucleoside transporter C-terminus-domain-containing protein [Apodospora peruviana]|uniref:Na+ dependent nucleoside transporter C-terminus-domain-containing protein n=1 Tax=Apodospora peruviana TaxID=516989 RepID=A0AAE0LYK3_9PEZI|nr:Na+ dependent nucleoside transporter C-terminus-domain-containing protein [Apodospora peruviana]
MASVEKHSPVSSPSTDEKRAFPHDSDRIERSEVHSNTAIASSEHGSDLNNLKDKETTVKPYDVDAESGEYRVGSVHGRTDGDGEQQRKSGFLANVDIRGFYRRWRPVFHIMIWAFFTAWWVYGPLVKHRTDDKGWLIPTLLYIALCIRLITFYVPVSIVMTPVRWLWNNSMVRATGFIPSKWRQPLAAVGTLAVFLVGSLVPEETGDNTRANRIVSIFGLIVMIVLLTVTSRDWKKIPWHTVIGGMLTQFVIAVFVLRTDAGYDIFKFISDMASALLGFAGKGTEFLTAASVLDLHWFLTGVIPPIIFFVALVQLLYHVGFLQWFIGKFATFFFWTLRVSGAEAVVAAATPFIGQGESAMLIRPFVPHLTLAEIHQVMTCGFATIAGSVLVAYMSLGLNSQALVSSCIMSIPASLAVSKMRFPETEETLTSGKVVVPEDNENKSANALHAFANGAWLGIKIAGMIIATLLCIIAFVALINGLLGWFGRYYDITDPELSLEMMLGYILYPVAWLLGVPKDNLLQVGELIGMKVITNEYVAFSNLTKMDRYTSMSPRAKLIALYACCGFGNIGSLGTQIGVLSQIAPGRAGDVSRVALSALFSGVLSTLTSASIAGMLMTGKMMMDMTATPVAST